MIAEDVGGAEEEEEQPDGQVCHATSVTELAQHVRDLGRPRLRDGDDGVTAFCAPDRARPGKRTVVTTPKRGDGNAADADAAVHGAYELTRSGGLRDRLWEVSTVSGCNALARFPAQRARASCADARQPTGR